MQMQKAVWEKKYSKNISFMPEGIMTVIFISL